MALQLNNHHLATIVHWPALYRSVNLAAAIIAVHIHAAMHLASGWLWKARSLCLGQNFQLQHSAATPEKPHIIHDSLAASGRLTGKC